MMRVGRAATADQARLFGDMADMLAVADAARLCKVKRALVDRFGFGALSPCLSRLGAASRRRLFDCCRPSRLRAMPRGRLPTGMRAAVVLRYVEGLSIAEAADAMGCSEGNVKSQSARGLERLREAMPQEAPSRARSIT